MTDELYITGNYWWARSLDMQLAVLGYPVVQLSVITAVWIQEASAGAVPPGNRAPDEATCPLNVLWCSLLNVVYAAF